LGSTDGPDVADVAALYGIDPEDAARGIVVLRPGLGIEGVITDVMFLERRRGRFPALVIDRGGSRVVLSAEHRDLRSALLLKAMLLNPKDGPLGRDEDVYRFLIGHRVRVRNMGRSEVNGWDREYHYEVTIDRSRAAGQNV
jgi:hypothetical protein